MARVFAVRVQIAGRIRVSRYKADCEPYIYHRLQILCFAVARSGFITSYKAVMGVGVRAKTVTNLLILLSVLGLGFILFPCKKADYQI